MRRPFKRSRSAASGQFVSPAVAKADPAGTVTETVLPLVAAASHVDDAMTALWTGPYTDMTPGHPFYELDMAWADLRAALGR